MSNRLLRARWWLLWAKEWLKEELYDSMVTYVSAFIFFLIFFVLLRIPLATYKDFFYFLPQGYQYSNPAVFFSIGEAVAAIAITLSVWQFKKEDWEIALEVRKNTIRILIGIISLGFLSAIIAAVVTFWAPSNIFEISLIWQILAAGLTIFAPVFLFIRSSNKNLFNEQNKERFIAALSRRVATRSPQKMDLVVDALIPNLKKLLEIVSKEPMLADIPAISRYAHSTLRTVIADPIFAKHIMTSRADFLQFFLKRIKEYHGVADTLKVVFDALVSAGFADTNSYFYNELQHSGLGRYKPFLNDIFYHQGIFVNLNPLSQFYIASGEPVDPLRLKLFLTCLELAIKGYWDKENYIDFEFSPFREAFEKVETLFSEVCREATFTDAKNNQNISSKLITIGFFVEWGFLNAYDEALKKKKVKDWDLQALRDHRSYGIYPKSMTAGYAQLIYNLLCALNSLPDKESRRFYAMNMAGDILLFSNRGGLEKIREVLLEYIWGKINGTSDISNNISGFYPVILSIFLSIIGMWQDGLKPETKALYNKTVEFLNSELKPKILADAKMANDELMEDVLLPPDVKFNKEKNVFEYQMHRATQEMVVRPV